jgi:hypothetical protein
MRSFYEARDLSINKYYQRMKTVTDALSDVGHAVSLSQLVLGLVCGLNLHFSSMADNIADTTLLLDFNTTPQKLVLKELCLANEGKVSSESALLVTSLSLSGISCRGASAHSIGAGHPPSS